MRRRLKVLTLGCKANFADSASIAGEAVSAGFDVVPDGEPADVIVVNSCSVTHRADSDSRALARRARRENPSACVIMAGCFAELSHPARATVPQVDHWIGMRGPKALRDLLRGIAGERESLRAPVSGYAAGLLLGRQRMFLKIQDGCDSRCAYCVVPLARGPSRSLGEGEVVAAAAAAEREGAREIVLTGIHAGLYGADRGESDALPRLVSKILSATSFCRIRLGSIEPLEIGPGLLSVMSGDPRVCPHLHVPLQSGSENVLRRMRRPYTAAQYVAAVSEAALRVADIRIGADVIVGFPGESRDDFLATAALLSAAPVHYLHVFPYSARNGTESALWPDDVAASEKKERVTRLRALDREKREAFLAGQVGKELDVLAERTRGARTVSGYSGNYATVSFPGAAGDVGGIHRVRIVGTTRDGLTGMPIVKPSV